MGGQLPRRADDSSWAEIPLFGAIGQCFRVRWPIVERGGVEICAIWPDERVSFGIERNPVEECQVVKGSIQFAPQDWLKIDDLLGCVVETDAQRVGSDDLELLHAT